MFAYEHCTHRMLGPAFVPRLIQGWQTYNVEREFKRQVRARRSEAETYIHTDIMHPQHPTTASTT